ncbi:hypothetical protein [Microbispora sp. KK1-11]|uniref:hypothetical protein n=1 Tax=Microbispora sp. KK1-11 TaxID=2053005 RepID=UPI00163D1DF4|nr:hypothetical protein [Microbispora sp. KK1-11]
MSEATASGDARERSSGKVITRPAVAESLRRCPSCGGWEYGGAPECPRCAELVDAIVEEGWRDFLLREFGDVSRPTTSGRSPRWWPTSRIGMTGAWSTPRSTA